MSYDADDLIELYAAINQLEADRLVLLLGEDGIEAIARATTMTSFPTSGAWLVQVRFADRAQATKVIGAARAEGAVSDRGEFIGASR
jgi:hypothetical protein